MKDQRSLTTRLLEERVQDLEAEVTSYSKSDSYLRIARRELRSLKSKLKHNRAKS